MLQTVHQESRIVLSFIACLGVLTACDSLENLRDALPERAFYIASTAMEPTLPSGASVIAEKITAEQAVRGEVLIVKHPGTGEDYVKRLVGLPGDEIAVEDGLIVLNGERVEQRFIEDYSYTHGEGYGPTERPVEAQRMREKLPGSPLAHYVLDQAMTQGDQFGPVTLGEDEYFFMGDNRDNSADSRFAPMMRGLGIVSGKQITYRIDLSRVEP